jgi:UDP-N-acetylmuramyl pentapeptide synthase
MLLYRHVKELFPSTKGIQEDTLPFQTVYVNPDETVSKGLYIPVLVSKDCEFSDCLLKAINGGAIGAIWPNDKQIPKFVPNHFPTFMVDDTLEAIEKLVDFYEDNLPAFNTNFKLSITGTHNEGNFTYDSPVTDRLTKLTDRIENVRGKTMEGGSNHA